MTDALAVLAAAGSFLLVDWPSREVPDTLALAGFQVFAHGGPGPADYFAYEVVEGEVVERRIGERPAQADVVWSYRPLAELPDIVEAARAVGAGTVWLDAAVVAGDDDVAAGARAMVEGAGLAYLDRPAVVDAVRER